MHITEPKKKSFLHVRTHHNLPLILDLMSQLHFLLPFLPLIITHLGWGGGGGRGDWNILLPPHALLPPATTSRIPEGRKNTHCCVMAEEKVGGEGKQFCRFSRVFAKKVAEKTEELFFAFRPGLFYLCYEFKMLPFFPTEMCLIALGVSRNSFGIPFAKFLGVYLPCGIGWHQPPLFITYMLTMVPPPPSLTVFPSRVMEICTKSPPPPHQGPCYP